MINSHGTITSDNYKQRCEETSQYGPLRVQLSRKVIDLLQNLNITHSLDGGNLVGAYRDGQMLPHDDDFDFVLYTDDIAHESSDDDKIEWMVQLAAKMKEDLQPQYDVRVVSSYAFKLEVFEPAHGKYSFKSADHHPVAFDTDYHNVTCDLTLMLPRRDEAGVLQYQHSTAQSRRHYLRDLLPIGAIQYEGFEYPAPANVENYLRSTYGYLGRDAVFNIDTGLYEQKT